MSALPSSLLSNRLRFRAEALLRLATDLSHDGPRAPGAAGFREDVLDLYGGAWASLSYKISKRLRLEIGARLYLRVTARRPEQPGKSFWLANGELHRTDFEALAGDSFVELSFSWLDLRAGMQTVVWGVNDLVNPNDVLNPRDLRLGLLTEAEATRLPTLGLKADVYLAGFNLTALWQPLFTPDQLDVFGSDYSIFGAGVPESLSALGGLIDRVFDDSIEGLLQAPLLATVRPRPLEGSTVALRVARSIDGWDLALQYVWGYQRLPVLRLKNTLIAQLAPLLAGGGSPTPEQLSALVPLLLAADAPISQTYSRRQQLGLSVSRALWRLMIDVDVSYLRKRPEPLAGNFPFVAVGGPWLAISTDTSVLAYTVGARYTSGDEILIKVEWWHELLLDVLRADDPPELLLGGGQRGGLAVMFRFLWRRLDLTGQFLAHVEVFNRALIFSPQLLYRVNQHLSLLGGVNLFVGQRGTAALLDDNDQVYLALKGFL